MLWKDFEVALCKIQQEHFILAGADCSCSAAPFSLVDDRLVIFAAFPAVCSLSTFA